MEGEPEARRATSATAWVVVAVVCALAFAGLVWDVLAHGPLSGADPSIERFVAHHRVGWITDFARAAEWIGSIVLLLPLIGLVSGYVLIRYREWRPLAMLAVAFGGVTGSHYAVKAAVDRPRPPASLRVGPEFVSGSYPSGHTAQAVAVWGVLALLAVGVMTRRRWLPVVAAVLIVALVGAIRVYLGDHWPTDVVGGLALGGAWFAATAATARKLWPDWPRREAGPPAAGARNRRVADPIPRST